MVLTVFFSNTFISISNRKLLRDLRSIFSEILKFQIIHENLFDKSLLELKLRKFYDDQQIEKEKKVSFYYLI